MVLFLINFTYQNKYLLLSVFPFLSKHLSFPDVSLQSMKDTFYQSSFTREYQNFHLSKRDEPKLAGYQRRTMQSQFFFEPLLKILNAKTIKYWYNERQLVSVPKGQCMDRLSKENKRDTCPMDSRPNHASKCLITSLSARLVVNLLSRTHYTTQSATLCK